MDKSITLNYIKQKIDSCQRDLSLIKNWLQALALLVLVADRQCTVVSCVQYKALNKTSGVRNSWNRKGTIKQAFPRSTKIDCCWTSTVFTLGHIYLRIQSMLCSKCSLNHPYIVNKSRVCILEGMMGQNHHASEELYRRFSGCNRQRWDKTIMQVKNCIEDSVDVIGRDNYNYTLLK